MNVTSQFQKENIQLRADLSHMRYKNQTLTNVVQRLNTEVEDLKGRMEGLELNSVKKAITISGLYTSEKKEYMIQEIQQFLETHLGVLVCVEDCFSLGNTQPKLVVAYLQTMQEKKDIMHFKTYLKDVRIRGKKIFINDYIPSATQEKRRREKDVRSSNQQLQFPAQLGYHRGNITLHGEIFKQKVSVPTPADLVNMGPEELTTTLATNIDSTPSFESEKSVFQGYTAEVKSFKDVNTLYRKMKLIQPEARHIVCAYWVEASTQHPLYNKGHCDDGEYGAGRTLLDILSKNQMKNRVVFAVRKYGGVRMGAERFSCYNKAVVSVLEKATGFISINTSANAASRAPTAESTQSQGVKRPATSPPERSSTDNTALPANVAPQPNTSPKRQPPQMPRNQFPSVSRPQQRGTFSHRRSPRYNYGRGTRVASRSYSTRGHSDERYQGQPYSQDNNWDYGTKEDWANDNDGSFYQNRKWRA